MTVLDMWTAKRRQKTSTRIPRRPLAETISTTARNLTTAASTTRTRFRRPALTLGGFGCVDAAFFQHGWFAGLLATGISVLVFETLGGDDE